MPKFVTVLLTACAAGLVSYSFPRLLIAAGVPLDAWIVIMGTWLGAPPDWVNVDTATWLFTLVFGLVLFGTEVWLHPVRSIWQFSFSTNKGVQLHSEDVMVATPYVQWKDDPQYNLVMGAMIWSGFAQGEPVTNLCFKRLKRAVRVGELAACKMNGPKPNKTTTVKTEDLKSWFESKKLMPEIRSEPSRIETGAPQNEKTQAEKGAIAYSTSLFVELRSY